MRSSDSADTVSSTAATATLEGFVARLHDEGVQAGRRQAELLREEAAALARQMVERAEEEAARLVAAAEERAATELARGRAELALAVRDALLELRAALNSALGAIVQAGADAQLRDPAFLGELIRTLVRAHATADGMAAGVDVRVPDALLEDLEAWTLRELGQDMRAGGVSQVLATLAEAGFELQTDGYGVEVTATAAREKLGELLSPRLRALFEEASARDGARALEPTGGGG